jgi:hypothetical protein
MKSTITLLFVALAILAFGQTPNRARDAYGSSACPFATGPRAMSTDELLDIPPLAQACIFVDRHLKVYAWVATRAENVIVMRTGYFFQDTDQTDAYIRWEDRKTGSGELSARTLRQHPPSKTTNRIQSPAAGNQI